MVEERGWVVAIEDQDAWVETQRQTACQQCSVRKGCGTAALSKVIGAKRTRLRVRNTCDAEIGDKVVLGMDDGALVKGSLLVYGVPLLAMLAGALFFEWLGVQLQLVSGDMLAILGGGIGLGVSLVLLRRHGRERGCQVAYQPQMIRVEAVD